MQIIYGIHRLHTPVCLVNNGLYRCINLELILIESHMQMQQTMFIILKYLCMHTLKCNAPCLSLKYLIMHTLKDTLVWQQM